MVIAEMAKVNGGERPGGGGGGGGEEGGGVHIRTLRAKM